MQFAYWKRNKKDAAFVAASFIISTVSTGGA